jgi:hypothetical protein
MHTIVYFYANSMESKILDMKLIFTALWMIILGIYPLMGQGAIIHPKQRASISNQALIPVGQTVKKTIASLPCPIADRCEDITATQTIGPTLTDPNCGDFQIFRAEGCLENAQPETDISDCGSNQHPTVWFKVEVDEEAVQLVTFVTTNGTWQPVWAIYHGSCGNLEPVVGGTINEPIICSDADSNAGEHSIGVIEGVSTYYLAVSGEGVIDDPNFSIELYSTAGCVSCIGGAIGCNTTATFAITERSSRRPLNDPYFCPGEEVTVCFSYLYDASETGVDWFHGLIPDFGPGWDLSAFDPLDLVVSPGNPEWLDEQDGECAPIITEQMPLLCTYTDSITGRLKLCNKACQTCPCDAPLLEGSLLPGGWFWSTNGGAGCENGCSPSTRYGIGSLVVNINLCVNLKVREFVTGGDCQSNRNLQINFQTTSDGVTGCWNDPVAECKLDKAQIGPNWKIDCDQCGPCWNSVVDTTFVTVYDTILVQDTITTFVSDTTFITITENIAVTDTLIINLNVVNSTQQPVVNTILVYPNPAMTHITVDIGEYELLNNYDMQILNALGQPVYFTSIDKKLYYLDLNGWSGKGIYFLKIKDPAGVTVQTKKIVLQ